MCVEVSTNILLHATQQSFTVTWAVSVARSQVHVYDPQQQQPMRQLHKEKVIPVYKGRTYTPFIHPSFLVIEQGRERALQEERVQINLFLYLFLFDMVPT